jgi:hypothetical protein
MAKGTITSIRPNRDDGRGFGAIAPDRGGSDLAFDNRSVEGLLPALARVLRVLLRPGAAREAIRPVAGGAGSDLHARRPPVGAPSRLRRVCPPGRHPDQALSGPLRDPPAREGQCGNPRLRWRDGEPGVGPHQQ